MRLHIESASTHFISLVMLLLIIFQTVAMADEAHSAFCFRSQSKIFDEFEKQMNRIAIDNKGGILNDGVCWWHSRLQRASFYLTRFAPLRPRPSIFEAKAILEDLTHLRKVVEIPGYENFYDFTQDYSEQVQEVLNDWQVTDGIFGFGWIKGMSGSSQLPAKAMQLRMDNLYEEYLKTSSENHLLWILVQQPGIRSHSLLVTKMTAEKNGYNLRVIDSNTPLDTDTLVYSRGENAIFDGLYIHSFSFVPYAGYDSDNKKIDAAINKECSAEYNEAFSKRYFKFQ